MTNFTEHRARIRVIGSQDQKFIIHPAVGNMTRLANNLPGGIGPQPPPQGKQLLNTARRSNIDRVVALCRTAGFGDMALFAKG